MKKIQYFKKHLKIDQKSCELSKTFVIISLKIKKN